jgi:L-lactate dehydrogenase complex protein LldG
VRSNALAETLHAVLAGEAVRSIVIATPLLEPCWPQFEARVTAGGVEILRGHDEGTLFSVDASVTGALAGIAETGSLLVAAGPAATRGESLYVPIHIALLPASAIIADLVDAAAVLADCVQSSSNATFITGPSKTADIEGVLVTGVHGPGVVHIVVIDDV